MGRCVLHPLPGGSPPPVFAGPHRANRIKRWKAAHKPGSVHRHRARGPCGGGDHLSGTAVTGGLERHWGYGTGRWPTLVPRAEALALLPAGVYRAGTSRCRWCALTAPLHPYLCGRRTEARRPPSAVCFCGTVLTVARTGRYPAGLAIGEPGLSSTGRSTTVAETLAALHRSRSPRLLSRVHVKQPTAGRCRPVEAGCWRGASLAIGWGIWGCSSAG